jgi:polysaccharide export outer membrane protein
MLRKILFFLAVILFYAFSCVSYAADKKNYILGAGDVIKIYVFQNPDLTSEFRVSEAGTISFPLLGEVEVQGLTPTGLEDKLSDALIKGGYLIKPRITVNVSQFLSQQVSVLGEVNKPGKYPLQGNSNRITDLLALAGGIGINGADTLTLIRNQNGKENKINIDVPELLRAGNSEQNIEVQSGDIIYVERAPVFYIYGEVQKPGAYRLERNMTVMQAVSVGGGITARGTTRGIQLTRPSLDGKNATTKVSLSDPVRKDDILYIKESLF